MYSFLVIIIFDLEYFCFNCMLDILKCISCPSSCMYVKSIWKGGAIIMIADNSIDKIIDGISSFPFLVSLSMKYLDLCGFWGSSLMLLISSILGYLYMLVMPSALLFVVFCISVIPLFLYIMSVLVSTGYLLLKVLYHKSL